MSLTPLSVSTLYYERSHQDLCDSSLWSLLSVLNFHSLNVLSKVHVFEPSHILKRSCDKIGGQFLSSPGGLHPHGPGAGPLQVVVGSHGLYYRDPVLRLVFCFLCQLRLWQIQLQVPQFTMITLILWGLILALSRLHLDQMVSTI